MSLLARNPDVAWVADPDRVALVRLDRPEDAPLVLTGGAVTIWQVLNAPMPVEELAAGVAGAVGVEPAVVAADVQAFVDEALGSGLLVSTGSTTD